MIRIALVDDHAVVRAGYRALLASQPDLAVGAEYGDAGSAYRELDAASVDVLVIDLGMPGAGALETIARLAKREPRLRALVFSMHCRASYVHQAFAAGARGYVTKSSEPEVLLRAVREVAGGRRFLSADVAQLLAFERFGDARGALDTLTVREFEVLRLLLAGREVDDIAGALNLSPKTVRNLHYIVKRKLGVRDDIELVRLALRLEVVDLLDLGDEAG
ncbi:MAG: response regulator transcription factor [Gammaproteobacteria bacterium]|nr:response regulator transcription factor [Gammaproteobacteria bacterium]MCP5199928.1 response regulator transcription factor [Gammaproteobacteria bacterium]